jgi:hypothetical protein
VNRQRIIEVAAGKPKSRCQLVLQALRVRRAAQSYLKASSCTARRARRWSTPPSIPRRDPSIDGDEKASGTAELPPRRTSVSLQRPLPTERNLHPEPVDTRRAANARINARQSCANQTPEGRKAASIKRLRVNRRPLSAPRSKPVTPEVPGSSPVAAVKSLHIGMLCCPSRRNERPPPVHPAYIPHGNRRTKPAGAANFRNPWCRPNKPEVVLWAGRGQVSH